MNDPGTQNPGGILIAEDCPVMIRTLTRLLITHGYEIAGIARDGIEAVKLFFENSPSIVLMDINMPNLDGIAATKKIKSKDPDARIVIISIETDRHKISQALNSGAVRYITKPVRPDRLLSVIGELNNS
jgi:two-component system chemotaxis response regulator CheY